MEPHVYEISTDKVPRIFERIEKYGILGIEVENVASFLDDMLNSTEEKLKYVRRLLSEDNVDKAVLVVNKGRGAVGH